MRGTWTLAPDLEILPKTVSLFYGWYMLSLELQFGAKSKRHWKVLD